MANPTEVLIDYTNYRGKRGMRRIRPLRIDFKSNQWHQTPQWILEAVDLDRMETREFAICEIRTWMPIEQP